ncbi:hypothetical protein DPMN_164732 [Dreissena polymorpha]|uniref:Uncharacterized protein n=1 Tax=Dreissena polymorpha TaxID=45954 RepID=A0A9D4EU57_DREPO|nr:hypothetical protein DPMN_164732 [Dreissena polymorpha]
MLNPLITCQRPSCHSQSAVERFLKVNEVVKELMLVWQVFLNHNSAVEDLFHCALPSSKSSLLVCQQFLGLTFKSI